MTSMDYYRGCLEPSSSSSSLSSLRISHNHAVDAVGNQPRILLIDSYCYYYYQTEWNGENKFAVSKFNKGNAKYSTIAFVLLLHLILVLIHWMRFFLKSEWMLFLISTRIFIISFNQSAHGAREARKKWGWRASESIWNEHFEFDTRKNKSWTHK